MAKRAEIYTCGADGDIEPLLAAHRIEVAVDLRSKKGRLAQIPVVTIAGLTGRDAAQASVSLDGKVLNNDFEHPAGPNCSANEVWEPGPLREFADHMQSEAFAIALGQLLDLARGRRIALLDEPAAWFRSTRGLLADRLSVGGHRVWHLHAGEERQQHTLTPGAQLSLQNRGNYALVVLGLS